MFIEIVNAPFKFYPIKFVVLNHFCYSGSFLLFWIIFVVLEEA